MKKRIFTKAAIALLLCVSQFPLTVPNEPSPMQPVECVAWEECQEFIARLNELTGREFHLPAVAQWRWAKRGVIHSQHYLYAGCDDVDEVA
ncbi:MAG: SUMF1/EgtB/PvdO family nonheme iron enzyme [Muribaculaceae bacterium]|nr:SUMF1/EgtB/PvdO family nonheme iron enzyme [Muribaculaceae bacterium]